MPVRRWVGCVLLAERHGGTTLTNIQPLGNKHHHAPLCSSIFGNNRRSYAFLSSDDALLSPRTTDDHCRASLFFMLLFRSYTLLFPPPTHWLAWKRQPWPVPLLLAQRLCCPLSPRQPPLMTAANPLLTFCRILQCFRSVTALSPCM